jgi:hypothetical protein
MRPTLGMGGGTIEPRSGSGRDEWENDGWAATPLGLKRVVGWGPRVAVCRPQPWAGGRERRRRREAAVPTLRRAHRVRSRWVCPQLICTTVCRVGSAADFHRRPLSLNRAGGFPAHGFPNMLPRFAYTAPPAPPTPEGTGFLFTGSKSALAPASFCDLCVPFGPSLTAPREFPHEGAEARSKGGSLFRAKDSG